MQFLKVAMTTRVNIALEPAEGHTADEVKPTVLISRNGDEPKPRKCQSPVSTIAPGIFSVELSSDDTNPVGRLDIIASSPAAKSSRIYHYHVVASNVYDSLFDRVDKLQVDMVQFSGQRPGR